MKKVIKIAGIAFIALMVIIALAGSGNKNGSSEIQDAFNKGKEDATEAIQNNSEFTKEEALKILQGYKTTIDLASPEIPKGTSLLDVYEIKGKIPAVKNLGWFTEETNEKDKYVVGYKQMVSENLPQEPRWEVTKETIKALNGKAISITPELQ